MVSKVLRRSGNAVCQYSQKIGWKPNTVFMAGVGMNSQELDVMQELWGNLDIYGFEPNPLTHKSILPNFPGYLFNQALGSNSGTATLTHPARHKDGSVLSSQTDEKKDGIVSHTVDVITLDEWLEPRGLLTFKNSLLWLDAEGSEYSILQGAEIFVEMADVMMINVELTGRPLYQPWCKPADVHRWMENHGYYPVLQHTLRIPLIQRDVIFVREDIYDETASTFPLRE